MQQGALDEILKSGVKGNTICKEQTWPPIKYLYLST